MRQHRAMSAAACMCGILIAWVAEEGKRLVLLADAVFQLPVVFGFVEVAP
jgi:hypothetical protein